MIPAIALASLVFFALVSVGFVHLDSKRAAELNRIARATRPRHGSHVVAPAVAHNRPGVN